MATVELYTLSYCPFCIRAKALLERKGVSYKDFDITGDSKLRAEMYGRCGGRHTAPAIFVDDRLIGGYDDLKALDDAGKLDSLLAGAGE